MTEAQIRYQAYLESEHWRLLRAAAFRKLGRKCSRCPSTCRLQIHHLRYRWPWTVATTEDLVVLCRECHGKEHGVGEVIVVQPAHQRRKKRKKSGKWRHEMKRVNQLLDAQRAGKKLKGKQKKFIRYFAATAHHSRPHGSGGPHWVSRGNSSN